MSGWLRELPWLLAAHVAAIPAVSDAIIRRAQRTPYTHIMDRDGRSVYMGRWWLFNAYGKGPAGEVLPPRWPWLPSVRVHHIMRPDLDRHLHDHPWNARTIVLRGWYYEERPRPEPARTLHCAAFLGCTGRLLFGQYHRITDISEGGVWTLFFTWRHQGTWGYLVDGKKVPHREYQGWQASQGR